MNTQLLIFHRPNTGGIVNDSVNDYNASVIQKINPNTDITEAYQTITRNSNSSSQGLSIDLYPEGVPIPITYTILDIRSPEQRKTAWSKTITIPGTKNNNRIFGHIYELGQDGWVTIGNTSYYEGFNPNLRKEVIILKDGVQQMKGNLQLKKITKDKNGNIEYEVALAGDLTSLFFDVGTSKLSDLDMSEWDHYWTKDNIVNSWDGQLVHSNKSLFNITNGTASTVDLVYRDVSTGRLAFQTTAAHNLAVEDWVKIESTDNIPMAIGEYQVAGVESTTKFSVNHFHPISLEPTGVALTGTTCYKRTASGRGYVYPMISWGKENDYNSFPVNAFIPGLFVWDIWNKIMKETNSNYESNFLDSQFFKRLVLIQNQDLSLSTDVLNRRKFWVGLTQSYLNPLSAGINTDQWFAYPGMPTSTRKVPFLKESGFSGTASFFDNDNNWNEDTYKWVVKDSGEYSPTANIKISVWTMMDGYTNGSYDGTASFNPLLTATTSYYPYSYALNGDIEQKKVTVNVNMYRLRSGVTTLIGSSQRVFAQNTSAFWEPSNPNWDGFGKYQGEGWKNADIVVTSQSKYFAKNDEVWCETKWTSDTNTWSPPGGNGDFTEVIDYHTILLPVLRRHIRGRWYVQMEKASWILNDPSPNSSENSYISANSILPKDMTCRDFLISIIKTFNLHIQPDRQVERLYYIEPREDFYYSGSNGATDYFDITDKIDNDSVISTPMGELTAKYYTFENASESDKWNTKFKNERSREYMYYQKAVQNDFLTNEVKVSVPLGSTVMINNPENSDVVMPCIVNDNGEPITNSKPRMLIWGGLKPYTAFKGGASINLDSTGTSGWELIETTSATSSVYTSYPFAGTCDSPCDPFYDLNWYNMEVGDFVYWDSARWTNGNLYNRYWKGLIDEISDPSSRLVTVYVNLTPKDIYNLDFRQIYIINNNYLRLQKVIDYDPVSDSLTSCEFLKLKSPSKFGRQSIIVDYDGISQPILSTSVDKTRAVITSTVEIAPSKKRMHAGFSNISMASKLSNTNSIKINGLSNFVAPNCKNINISGTENVINDGCRNINITGGNGNFIQGGVTNVNLIGTSGKYITESNVTYVNNIKYEGTIKNTITDGGQDMVTLGTVIDGGEDIVKYCKVFDGGQDCILSNMHDVGISTSTNPNPRTNFSGGYALKVGASQSLVDIVREAAKTTTNKNNI